MDLILIVAAVFLAAWFIQFIYLLLVPLQVMRRSKKKEMPEGQDDLPGVSVVVYSHNQGEALLSNLTRLLENDYPNFEVIVVDDMSNDDTQDVLTIIEQRNDNIFHTRLTDKVRNMSHRKLALLLGVKAAHYDIILTTKAQCVPASKDWIMSMASRFSAPKVDIVLGPVSFENRTGPISRFCQYDLFQRLVFMLGMAITFRAFAGWGNNLAFRKPLLFVENNKAFARHLFIHPGEDDLMVGEMVKRGNVVVESSASAMVFDQESPLRNAWSKDRLTRAFTGKRYSFGSKFMKSLDTLTRYVSVFTGLFLVVWFIMQQLWIHLSIVAVLLFLRMLLLALFSYFTAKRLGIHRFFFSPIIYDLWTPIIDLFYWIRASVNNRGFYVSRV